MKAGGDGVYTPSQFKGDGVHIADSSQPQHYFVAEWHFVLFYFIYFLITYPQDKTFSDVIMWHEDYY